MTGIGRRRWAIAGGRIPLKGTGREPEFTSHEWMCILNATDEEARVELTVYHADREPVGPYVVRVPARRVKRFRFNDLIDPEAVPLEADYACVVESDVPVLVQFGRQDTRQAENALFSTTAFPLE